MAILIGMVILVPSLSVALKWPVEDLNWFLSVKINKGDLEVVEVFVDINIGYKKFVRHLSLGLKLREI
jgi:hypothetical protein